MLRPMRVAALLAVFAVFPAKAADLGGKRVLFIESYSEDYQWSADTTHAVRDVLRPAGVVLREFHMDTKNHPSEDAKLQKAAEAKAVIDSFHPDVVVAADDNAAKYVVVPFLKGGTIPVVVCGINYDATKYGFPAPNVTGIIEVDPYSQVFAILKAMGIPSPRIAAITPDNESDRANLEGGVAGFQVTFSEIASVSTFADWKAAYARLQGKVDVILLYNNGGLTGWDDAEAERFVNENTHTLTISFASWFAPFAAVVYARTGAEQGQWAAETALKILSGGKPADFPLAHNRQDTLSVNQRLARKAGHPIPAAIVSAASKVIE